MPVVWVLVLFLFIKARITLTHYTPILPYWILIWSVCEMCWLLCVSIKQIIRILCVVTSNFSSPNDHAAHASSAELSVWIAEWTFSCFKGLKVFVWPERETGAQSPQVSLTAVSVSRSSFCQHQALFSTVLSFHWQLFFPLAANISVDCPFHADSSFLWLLFLLTTRRSSFC